MTAAPLPGVSPPRFGSRAPVGRTGNAAPVTPKPGLNHLARRDIPARRRTTNGLEAVGTNDPLLAGYTSGPRNDARLNTLYRRRSDLRERTLERQNCQFGRYAQEAERRGARRRFPDEAQPLILRGEREQRRPCSLLWHCRLAPRGCFGSPKKCRRPQRTPAFKFSGRAASAARRGMLAYFA